LGLENAELSILLTGDRKMRTLNRDWRGIDKTTDVLSFSALEGADDGPISRKEAELAGMPLVLGDIVISAPKALAQATERGVSFEDELVFLLIHGILHLIGYDHEAGANEKRKMERKQAALFLDATKATTR